MSFYCFKTLPFVPLSTTAIYPLFLRPGEQRIDDGRLVQAIDNLGHLPPPPRGGRGNKIADTGVRIPSFKISRSGHVPRQRFRPAFTADCNQVFAVSYAGDEVNEVVSILLIESITLSKRDAIGSVLTTRDIAPRTDAAMSSALKEAAVYAREDRGVLGTTASATIAPAAAANPTDVQGWASIFDRRLAVVSPANF